MLSGLKSLFRAKPATSGAESARHKQQGDEHLRAGRLDAAGPCYRRALSADPDHVDACVGLGFVLSEQRQHAEAAVYLQHALSIAPETVDAHYILGTIRRNEGDLPAAIDHFGRALDVKPDFEFASRELIATLVQAGQIDKAKLVLGRAITAHPESGEFQFNLGKVLNHEGDFDGAVVCFQNALATQPGFPEAHRNLADAQRKRGQLGPAVASYREALRLDPENFVVHCELGMTLHDLGHLSEAEASYRRALELKPDYPEAKLKLALALQAKGYPQQLIQLLIDLVTTDPGNGELRSMLADALRGVAIPNAGEKARAALLSLCVDDSISSLFLTTSVLTVIKNLAGFLPLQKSARGRDDPFRNALPAVAAFLSDPLLLAALPRMLVADTDLEAVFTHMRRCILLRRAATGASTAADPEVPAEFLCALARQCFLSGYAQFADEQELRHVARLRAMLAVEMRNTSANPRGLEPLLAITALYDYLHTVDGWERLRERPASDWSESFRPIVQDQVENRVREREIAAQLSSITAIDDHISVAVRAQYEENPYPRWVTAPSPQPETIEVLARRLRPGEPIRTRPRPFPVLVAGCGTGHHSVQVARSFPDSEILAVDLSLASLAYAARMTARLGITNITYRQADILKLASIDRRFDIVECGGVLHHLDDPMAGWRVLAELLESDGLMSIALYSEKARSPLAATREFIRATQFPPTPEGIRRCRHAIIGLPAGHPARSAVTTTRDFYSLDQFRDLVMHVQEHRFTLCQIAECLDQLGLRFLRLQCAAATLNRFKAMFPQDDSETDLDAWDRFETAHPDTFKGMYVFWCCRR
jgi:tetratricopeptide (TPR) repeat protein/2-polyprenyl-3-methyl-5-hydroxy-6-metoxy-1,4-benzoquinol methylase